MKSRPLFERKWGNLIHHVMDDDIKKHLDEQSVLLREIHRNVAALHRAMVWGRVWSAFSILAFVILPLVLVYYYIYPAFQSYMTSFHQVTSGQMRPDQFLQNIPPIFQSILKWQGIDINAIQKQAQAHVQSSQHHAP